MMALYVKKLYVLATREEADAFNDARDYSSEFYAQEYAIFYGALLSGVRYHEIEIQYDGVRNSKYEAHLAQFQRADSYE